MKRTLILLIAAAQAAASPGRIITIADRDDRSPIPGASVISSNGMIIGITDSEGKIEVNAKDYPLSLGSIGYEALSAPAAGSDTLLMTPCPLTLSEVVVTPEERPVTRILTYAREYCTGATPTDTLQLYGEYMLEYFLADGKVKGYSKSHRNAHELASRHCGRIANASGTDSIMLPTPGDDLSMLSFATYMASVPQGREELTEAMRNGATADTLPGKYGPKQMFRLANGLFSSKRDILADYKDHSWSPWFFRLIGMTTELQEADITYTYRHNESGAHGADDFVCGTYALRLLGKGRLFKKMMGIDDALDMRCHIEQYPVLTEHLTVREYQEMKKSRKERTESFRVPAGTPPPAPAIRALTERAARASR
ncbi:MAG: hypothetical protein U0L83_08775 [Muribaculaceae bacterium]|nr:hypothetical protein [Muribaculaceae bacterium]